jgi:quercetin dioxygenase-like cupin family protein
VLSPGRQPHAPHVHPEEELLLVLDGEPELVIVDGGEEQIVAASPGTLAYYPRTQRHTIRNPGPGNATYVMLKWAGPEPARPKPALATGLHHITGRFGDPGGRGMATATLFEGPTAYLEKLHSHLTTLEPGGGYEPHRDLHAVALLLLEGVVETLGERIEPAGVIYYPAGTSHGIRNVGDGPARYVVFEFHGDACGEPAPSARSGRTAALRSLRCPAAGAASVRTAPGPRGPLC